MCKRVQLVCIIVHPQKTHGANFVCDYACGLVEGRAQAPYKSISLSSKGVARVVNVGGGIIELCWSRPLLL